VRDGGRGHYICCKVGGGTVKVKSLVRAAGACYTVGLSVTPAQMVPNRRTELRKSQKSESRGPRRDSYDPHAAQGLTHRTTPGDRTPHAARAVDTPQGLK